MMTVLLSVFGSLLLVVGPAFVNAAPFQLSCASPFDCRWIGRNDDDATNNYRLTCTSPFDCRWLRSDGYKLLDDIEAKQMYSFPSEDIPRYAATHKRQCIHLGDEGCTNGQLPGSGKDDGFLGGGGTPGKRSPFGMAASH